MITAEQRQQMLIALYEAYKYADAHGVGGVLRPYLDGVQKQVRAMPLADDPVPPAPPAPPPAAGLPIEPVEMVESPTRRITVLPGLGRITAIPVRVPAGPFALSPMMTLALAEHTGMAEGALRAACIADQAGDMGPFVHRAPGKFSQGRAVAIDMPVSSSDAGRVVWFNHAYLADFDNSIGPPAAPGSRPSLTSGRATLVPGAATR